MKVSQSIGYMVKEGWQSEVDLKYGDLGEGI